MKLHTLAMATALVATLGAGAAYAQDKPIGLVFGPDFGWIDHELPHREMTK